MKERAYPVRTVSAKDVVGRCFICATPLTRNRWKWMKAGPVRSCRDRRACTWRNDRGICDTVV